MKHIPWFVPEYDKARPAMKRIATIELTVDFQIQVVPDTMGDVKLARVAAAAPELLDCLKEVVAISDRKHVAWDRAHALIAKAEAV